MEPNSGELLGTVFALYAVSAGVGDEQTDAETRSYARSALVVHVLGILSAAPRTDASWTGCRVMREPDRTDAFVRAARDSESRRWCRLDWITYGFHLWLLIAATVTWGAGGIFIRAKLTISQHSCGPVAASGLYCLLHLAKFCVRVTLWSVRQTTRSFLC